MQFNKQGRWGRGRCFVLFKYGSGEGKGSEKNRTIDKQKKRFVGTEDYVYMSTLFNINKIFALLYIII